MKTEILRGLVVASEFTTFTELAISMPVAREINQAVVIENMRIVPDTPTEASNVVYQVTQRSTTAMLNGDDPDVLMSCAYYVSAAKVACYDPAAMWNPVYANGLIYARPFIYLAVHPLGAVAKLNAGNLFIHYHIEKVSPQEFINALVPNQ